MRQAQPGYADGFWREAAFELFNWLFSRSHNAIRFGGSLHKNNTIYLPLGLYHASVNWLSIVLM